jgi:hypothetical protein
MLVVVDTLMFQVPEMLLVVVVLELQEQTQLLLEQEMVELVHHRALLAQL